MLKLLSHQCLPGKVGTKFMATPGMAGGQPSTLGRFARALGSEVEAAGVEDFQREGQSGECLEPPEVLGAPEAELRAIARTGEAEEPST